MNVHLLTAPAINIENFPMRPVRGHEENNKLTDGLRILRVALREADAHRIGLCALHVAKLAEGLNCPNLARLARELRSAHAMGEAGATTTLAARLFRLGQAITMGQRMADQTRART